MGKFNCKLLKNCLLILFLISAPFISNSQELISLGLYHEPGTHLILVKAKSSAAIPNWYISNIIFTIRWSKESNITQLDGVVPSYGLSQQGGVREDSGKYYVTFASSGSNGFAWVAGTQYTILKFDYSSTAGCTPFYLSDDAFTYDFGDNYFGNFYIEILGNDYTNYTQLFYKDSVNAKPGISIPTVTGTTDGSRCGTGSVSLGATPSSLADIKWYTASTGGTSLFTGNTFSTPSIASTTNFYVDASRYGCYSSPRNMVVATVYPAVSANAGTDQLNTGTWTGTLGGNNPSPNSGAWSVLSGGSLAFNPGNTAYNAQVTTTSYRTYKLLWTVSSAHCSANDTVLVAFNAPNISTFSGTNNWYTFANWDNGVPDTITHAYINGDVTINSRSRCNQMTINEGGKVTINSLDTLTIFNNFLLKSSVSGTGSIIDNGKLKILGTTTVQRYFPSYSKYSFVSSPVTSALSNVFFHAWLYKWLEPTQTWYNIFNTNIPITPMVGYSVILENVTGNPSIPPNNPAIFTGTLNTGAIGASDNVTNTHFGAGNLEGFNLIGNPYPSAIDWEASSGWTKTNVDNAIYFWANNQYASYVNEASTNGGSRYIPAMQGFFVRRTHSSFGTGTVIMDNSVRVHNTTAFYKSNPVNFLRLSINGNNLTDETVIRFDNSATNSFDSQYDAYKLFGLNTPQLYTVGDDASELSINTLTEVLNNTNVNMYFKPCFNGVYSITATELNSFDPSIYIFLEDHKTQQSQLLNTNPLYSFNADTLDVPNRFVIKFIQSTNGITEKNNNDLIVFASGKTVYIKANNVKGNLDVVVTDLLGREVAGKKITDSNINEMYLDVVPGYYIVKLAGDKTNQSTKVFIN